MSNFSTDLIEEIVPNLICATLAKPTQNSHFNKAKVSKYKTDNFYVEQFTQKQAFQKILSYKDLVAYLIENIGTNFKHVYIETDKTRFTFLANKKGKITVLEQDTSSKNVLAGSPHAVVQSGSPRVQTNSSSLNGATVVAASGSPGGSLSSGKIVQAGSTAKSPRTDVVAGMPRGSQNSGAVVQAGMPRALGEKVYFDSANKKKNYILQEGKPIPFLVHLGVMSADGKVISKKYDKFRQLNRFLEYVRDILPTLQDGNSEKVINIIDFGCGKSYLTFALYYYLNDILGLKTQIIGLDLKDDVITMCSLLAKEFGFSGLQFFTGSIEDYFAKNSQQNVDLVITLHACDTATDYALASAIKQKAKAILSVPCCQHELNQNVKKTENKAINTILKYGIAKERFLALATDVMRCELLQQNGYSVQLLEFIDMTNTPKNLLIRAVFNDKNKACEYTELANLIGQDITLAKLLNGEN